MFQGDAAKLKLPNPVSNESKKLKDTLGDSDASAQEKRGKEKNCDSVGKQEKVKTEASSNVLVSSVEKDKFSGNDERTENLKRKELCVKLQMKQHSNGSEQVAVQKFLKSCANQEKSMPLVKKSKSLSKVSFCDDNLVQFDKGDTPKVQFSSNAESFQSAAVNPNASSRTYMDKSSFVPEKQMNFNGLSLDSNGKIIKFSSSGKVEMNQPDKSSKLRGSFSGLPVGYSPHHSSRESLSIGERNVASNTLQNQATQELFNRIDSELKLIRDSSIQQNKEDKILPKESSSLISPCYSQPRMSTLKGKDAVKHKPHSGSKLQISPDNLYQPVKLERSKPLPTGGISMKSHKFQQGNLHQNRSIGSVGRTGSSIISDPFRSRTIPQGLFAAPALNNGTSSAFELSQLPPPPPSSWCPPAPVVQPAHVRVTNQPSPINQYTVKATTKDNHQLSSSRKRLATEFIDLTKPNKLPNVEQENSSRVTKTYKDLIEEVEIIEGQYQSPL
ncbi:hypothetical protein L195_g008978 [Trifolium pratense]|uniref:Uncharacterized protein n=1 Tax=Trifolium pratense TaxID=57577 RepID=A0A2K3PAM8_TRIPR|nr:hypothetical protein L195_g008978 [Trifolium pratense]